jgi:hypothetical protein
MQSIDRNRGASQDGPDQGKSAGERVTDLLAECRADYGTPRERADRAVRARCQSSLAIEHEGEAAL